VLLGFLSQRAAHGYELHQRLEADLGQIWRLGLNQTYTILNRLETRGFIQKIDQEPVNAGQGAARGARRRRFELTEAGRRRFELWLGTPTPATIRAVRVEFTTRLYFAAAVSPQLAAGLIDAQVQETGRNLDRLQATLQALPDHPPFNRLGLRLRVRTLASLLDWLEECRLTLGLPRQRPANEDTAPGN
jgi:DNA-binding PadR family transcriptional regulator